MIVCGLYFNQDEPTAGTLIRLGWAHAFEKLGVPYLLVSPADLAGRLSEVGDAICVVSGSDYDLFDKRTIAALRRTRHVVWVDTWFPGDVDFYERHGFEFAAPRPELRNKILATEPTVVFTISPEGAFDYYSGWLHRGIEVISLPLACDSTRYMPPADRPGFEDVEIAFVGNYWAYKARQYDHYLRPYADRLTIFGHTKWPYAGYRGQLPEDDEPVLYRNATLAPAINEPHVEVLGTDVNERVFKVLGSGGLAITDATLAYREWFEPSELLMPGSRAEYHDHVRAVLSDPAAFDAYRDRGLEAIRDRHTYVHRVEKLLRHLDIEVRA